MESREFKGVWIPAPLYLDTSLSWTQKLILVEVDSFTKNNLDCFVSNSHLAKFIGVSESAIEKAISSLVKGGFLERTLTKKVGGTHRVLKSTLSLVGVTPSISCESHPQLDVGDTPKKVRHTNTTTTNTKTTNTKKGKPSSFLEVFDYFTELQIPLEAQKFCDWYDSVGWKVKGGNSIKDWKAAARQWKSRNNKNKTRGFKEDNFDINALEQFVNNREKR